MSKTQPRRVYVRLIQDTWMVCYADRKARGRYSPAQFHKSMMSRKKVEDWVNARPDKYTLIPDPQE